MHSQNEEAPADHSPFAPIIRREELVDQDEEFVPVPDWLRFSHEATRLN